MLAFILFSIPAELEFGRQIFLNSVPSKGSFILKFKIDSNYLIENFSPSLPLDGI